MRPEIDQFRGETVAAVHRHLVEVIGEEPWAWRAFQLSFSVAVEAVMASLDAGRLTPTGRPTVSIGSSKGSSRPCGSPS